MGEWAHGCATMGGAGAGVPGHGARRHGAKGRWAHLETSHEEERLKGNNKRGALDQTTHHHQEIGISARVFTSSALPRRWISF